MNDKYSHFSIVKTIKATEAKPVLTIQKLYLFKIRQMVIKISLLNLRASNIQEEPWQADLVVLAVMCSDHFLVHCFFLIITDQTQCHDLW